jgi:hypothetical protein
MASEYSDTVAADDRSSTSGSMASIKATNGRMTAIVRNPTVGLLAENVQGPATFDDLSALYGAL